MIYSYSLLYTSLSTILCDRKLQDLVFLFLYNLLDSLEFYKKVCVKSKTEIFEQCEQLWQLDN